MSIGMNFPKCPGCDTTYGIAIGLPVWVSFSPEGEATISVDLGELSDIDEEGILCACEGERPEIAEGVYGDLVDRLSEITNHGMSNPEFGAFRYQITGYGRCGACGLQHDDSPGACDLDPVHEVNEGEVSE